MSWSYSGNPSASQLDEIRYLTSDTVATSTWTNTDEEINYALAKFPNNVLLAAAVAAEGIMARFSSLPESKKVADLSLSWSQRVKYFQDLAHNLRTRAALAGVPAYVGGTSRTEKQTADADTDRIEPAARVDGMNWAAPRNTDPSTGV